MCIQDMICCCCGGAALVLVGAFASFGDHHAEPATVELMLSGDDSAIAEAAQQLVASQEDWDALWARHLGPDAIDPETGEVSPAAPDVDFDTQLVVAVFIGRGSTSSGLKLTSYTSEDDQLTIRFLNRSYQTTMRGRKSDENGEAEREWEERYGSISAYGFFLLSRSDREIVLVQELRSMAGGEPRLIERARFTPPVPTPVER